MLRVVSSFMRPCADIKTSAPPGIRPVTHLFLSEVTSDAVLVAWSSPAPPADLFILSYSSADGTDTSKVTLEGSKTRSLVQGLLPATQYTISLITVQGESTSEPITASLTTGELCEQASLADHNPAYSNSFNMFKHLINHTHYYLLLAIHCIDLKSFPKILSVAQVKD